MGVPDIEIIYDIVFKHSLTSGEQHLKELEDSIRDKIINIFKSVKQPNLELHVKFLKALKSIIGPKARCIYIFTTNYDLLIENAAQHAKIPVFNGFVGTIFRYFDIARFKMKYGQISNRIFYEFSEPYIKLIKLHGSISWKRNENNVYEIGDYFSLNPNQTSIILPKTQKIRETLEYPYNHLFSYTSRTIGTTQCRYLISLGCSLRDNHINDSILIPQLRTGKLKFFATFKDEPVTIDKFKEFRGFNYLTQNKVFTKGELTNEPSDLWDFNQFVKELAFKAGIE